MKYFWLVVNLEGEVVGSFNTEDEAHYFANDYGKRTGRFAYVEFEGGVRCSSCS